MRGALSLPLISDRDSYDEWYNKGRIDSVAAARAKVREILASHQAPPLADPMRREMGKLVAAYSK
jgi:trimethylamine:corrinoid methyltransferase-like protein